MYIQQTKKNTPGSFLKHGASVLMAGALLFAYSSTGAKASETRQHGAHVHGIANLNVALDGNNLMIELDSPSANIVGFEHAPENEEQAHAVHEAMELLKNGEKLFGFTEQAGCTLHDAHVDTDMETDHHDEHESHDQHNEKDAHDEHDDHAHAEKDHDHEHDSTHSEFEVSYHFECAQPDKLKSIEVKLFNEFPGFERIDAQVLTGKGQSAAGLTAKSPEISL